MAEKVYMISYYNALLDNNYEAITTNPLVLKAFLRQLGSNKCVATISGGTETIREYYDSDYSDMNPNALLLYHSEVSDTSLYLTSLMIDQMEELVHGPVEYMAHQLPDDLTYYLMPFTKGSFKNKLVKFIIPAMYSFYDDDTHLDTVNVICNKDLCTGIRKLEPCDVFSTGRGWL